MTISGIRDPADRDLYDLTGRKIRTCQLPVSSADGH